MIIITAKTFYHAQSQKQSVGRCLKAREIWGDIWGRKLKGIEHLYHEFCQYIQMEPF